MKRKAKKPTKARKATPKRKKSAKKSTKKRRASKKTTKKKAKRKAAKKPAKPTKKTRARAKASGVIVFFNGHRYPVKLEKKGKLYQARAIGRGGKLGEAHPLHAGRDGVLRTLSGTGAFAPARAKVANPTPEGELARALRISGGNRRVAQSILEGTPGRDAAAALVRLRLLPNPLLGVTLGIGNPKPARKPKKAKKAKRRKVTTVRKVTERTTKTINPKKPRRRSAKGALERYLASKPDGFATTWSKLPEGARKDPAAIKAANKASRCDKVKLADVRIEKTPDAGVYTLVGEKLLRLDYKVGGKSHRATAAPYGYTHAAGDHGKGKRKTRPCAVAQNVETGQIVLVRRKGSRTGYGPRGIEG